MKPYPKYKDSGIEWLGKIPLGWEVKKLKYLSDFVNGYAFDSERYTDEGVPVIRIGDISDVINFDSVKKIPEDSTTGLDKFKVKYGDILLALTGATIGKTAIYNSKGFALLNQRVAILRGKKLNQKFLTYFIASEIFKENIDYLCYGGAQENIGKNDVGSIIISCPSFVEQQAIANFLDQKITKIDELIKKDEKLIELLKEKRQAIISHAVTKGLNPNANMKDSGIEWIGEVPEGWGVKRLKFNLQLLTKKTDRRENPVALENIESWLGRYKETESEFQGEGVAFKKGDILFGKLRPYLAKAWLADFSGEAIGDFFVMRPLVDIDGRFAVYQILNKGFISIVDGSTFGAKMPRVSWDFMANLRLPTPSIEEQHAIADYLDCETVKIDGIISKIQSQIAVLKEYRQALISNVVTGKVKVS